mmetsp:Transcript_18085/g.38921  ORF Transcript_18085/g.38921 Transcript_18085/m.38921 type:complete len:451 (+) Transcript_18085:83-1435(+)
MPSRVVLPVFLLSTINWALWNACSAASPDPSTSINATDTFQLCHIYNQNRSHVQLEQLVKVYGLPNLPAHVSLEGLLGLLRKTYPLAQLAQVVSSPANVLDVAATLSKSHFPGNSESSAVHQHPFPRLVHITVPDKNQLIPPQALTIASWILLNPGYTVLVYEDPEVRGTIERHFPQHLQAFDALPSSVERTDLWRYLAICAYGGVYADSDVACATPVDHWADVSSGHARLLVGIENAFSTPEEAKHRTYARQVQMAQWTIAGRPGHPVTCRMGDYVRRHMQREQEGVFSKEGWDTNRAVLERTGPGIWTNSVMEYITQHSVALGELLAGRQVDDMRLLPQMAFGCPTIFANLEHLQRTIKAVTSGTHSMRMLTSEPSYQMAPYVYHCFLGSWKVDEHEHEQYLLRVRALRCLLIAPVVGALVVGLVLFRKYRRRKLGLSGTLKGHLHPN